MKKGITLNEAVKRRAKNMDKSKGITLNEAAEKGYFKYIKRKVSINESEINGLKDALENMEEFSDENIMGSVVGKDYVISIFEKVCIILVNGTTPFLIEREDITEDEQTLIDDVFETLNLELDDDIDDDLDNMDDNSDDGDLDNNLDDDLDDNSINESRKIDKKIGLYFYNSKPIKDGNTVVSVDDKGNTEVRLHDNLIAVKNKNGDEKYSLAGYNSQTTRARLNGLGFNVVQRKGKLFVDDNEINANDWYDIFGNKVNW
ncbi:hypothetical protein F356_159 [Campylobacter phage F356]|uniref:Uncharacterized protein n=6 Tax=Fletchervirus CPX TaxID=1110702 RepID=A0A7T3N430_9CAUD|nr:hypothetical protein F348_158 [Campylobacter phage F348]QPX63461.1 hypothetical protein F352_157 [Campylobacter phage F352]QPX63628.1 hypothetical protein F355_157 [Campylobacter phage F355]QPX63797.1 hypothetical protein F356_159 [Campylobacter phage F356]QPX65597.1 hypothetical protein F374_156 [Campylobacter phage F374]QPX65764.1 hypothetical protein F375_157 [Campylobacter phage F375]QQV87903.1 hypothetical protein [Campylobacter phage CJLB-7]